MLVDLLQCSPEERKQILAVFNRNTESIKGDIATLKAWKLTQPHLPEMPTDFMIEKFLIMNKMSIEKTKLSLDYYYSVKNIFPETFTTRVPNFYFKNQMYYFPLPKLHKNCRITYCRFLQIEHEKFYPMEIFKAFSHYAEVRLAEDYSLAEISISDLSNMTFKHATRFEPGHLKTMSFLSENVFRNNIREMHILNPPPYIEAVISFIKGYFPEKLVNRIRLHKNIESLHDLVPKSFLPKDLGGDERSIEELQNLWYEKLENFLPRYKQLDSLIINEKLRPEKLTNHETLGFHGNFRKLDLD